ncbi:hypothetical protein AWB68_07601 [Caballeronia choica]|uniref:Uncharacterized protein n=1 Tax=Caballeronia choica TaxID=326476 RepID=A0A158KVS0_9BURK|nr:hypothetical protein AWB68_07601 [Caballeronia choica]
MLEHLAGRAERNRLDEDHRVRLPPPPGRQRRRAVRPHGIPEVGMQARDVRDVGRTDPFTAGDDPAGWLHRLESGRARNENRSSVAGKHEGPLLEVPEQPDRAGSSKHQVENGCDARIQTDRDCRDHDFRHRVGTSHSQGLVRSLRSRAQGHRCAHHAMACRVSRQSGVPPAASGSRRSARAVGASGFFRSPPSGARR